MSNSLSAKGKIWRLPSDIEPAADLLDAAEQSSLLAKILLSRGITDKAQAMAFLSPQHFTPSSPFALPDMDKALARINQALEKKEKITVYGDYDVDGITGTSLLLTALRRVGAQVNYYIPNRASEGYGLNLKAVSVLASKQQTKLLITCDCGVANFAEINFAKSLGLETIVLDHHALPELLPPAKAIVHPKLLSSEHPLFHLPGVGVAFKVAEALLTDHGMADQIKSLLDYVTLGMIADLVPLIRENRYLVQLGLPLLIKSKRPGIQALLSQIKPSGDTDLVGFGLAPRINAVGRLSDAKAAVDLMTTDDPELAKQLALDLQNENTRRQQICEQVFMEADHMVTSKGDISQQKAIAIYKEGWHHGVVGIVASRLVDKYHRPVFIGELDTDEGIVRGSARGVEALDLCVVLKANESLLSKWGGHKMAAGFSMPAEKADAFCAAIVASCNRALVDSSMAPTVQIDVALEDMGIDLFSFAKTLLKLAPFGMENKKPVLFASKLFCEKTMPLGRENKHHRLDLIHPETKTNFSCVFWNTHNIIPENGSLIDIAFTPEINTYNGRERLQLVLTDWRLSAKHADSKISVTPLPIAATPPPFSTQTQSVASNSIAAMAAPHSNLSFVPQITWHDLRHRENEIDVLEKATAKLGDKLAIFSEETASGNSIVYDRVSLPKKPHLLIRQYPPSAAAWQQILTASAAEKIYLVGKKESEPTTAPAFIKRLLGLVRYVIKNKAGSVETPRLAAALATTDMAIAMALTLLAKLNWIEWYADEGIIYLDLLDSPAEQEIKHFTEYYQLEEILQQINLFRRWSISATIEELQQVIANHTKENIDTIATKAIENTIEECMVDADTITTVDVAIAS